MLKKLLTGLALTTTMLMTAPKPVETVIPETNYDYVATWEKQEVYDNCVVQKDKEIYYGSFNVYIVDVEIFIEDELEQRVYYVESITTEDGEEIIFRVKRDK